MTQITVIAWPIVEQLTRFDYLTLKMTSAQVIRTSFPSFSGRSYLNRALLGFCVISLEEKVSYRSICKAGSLGICIVEDIIMGKVELRLRTYDLSMLLCTLYAFILRLRRQ